jgi:hypothetical protein
VTPLLRRGAPRSCPPFLLQRGYPSGAKLVLGHPTARLPGSTQQTCPAIISQCFLDIHPSKKVCHLKKREVSAGSTLTVSARGTPPASYALMCGCPSFDTRETSHGGIFTAYGTAGENPFEAQALQGTRILVLFADYRQRCGKCVRWCEGERSRGHEIPG